MSQLLVSAAPGFVDIPEGTNCAANQPVTDYTLTKISQNAKYAALRSGAFDMGFYGPGDTVPTPTRPEDGTLYLRSECVFYLLPYSMRSPAPGYVPGQSAPPALASTDPGTASNPPLLSPYIWKIDPLSGVLTLQVYYAVSGVSNQGCVHVFCDPVKDRVINPAVPGGSNS